MTAAEEAVARYAQYDERKAELEKAEKLLSDLRAEEQRLQKEYDCAVTALAEAQAHLSNPSSLPKILEQLTAQRDAAQRERDRVRDELARFEKAAEVAGVPASKAVKLPANEPGNDDTPSGAWSKYKELRKGEKDGSVAQGTARKFWRENKDALRKYANYFD